MKYAHTLALAALVGTLGGTAVAQQSPTTNTTPVAAATTPAAAAKAPAAITALFGDKLQNAQKAEVGVDTLAGKTIGVYFSAHWCRPCRAFTPKLAEFHQALAKSGKPFEVVFVSSDRNPTAMAEYMKGTGMPWLAIPHGDARAAALKSKFGITGIPTLVILAPDGSTVTMKGRADVATRGEAAFEEWQKKYPPATDAQCLPVRRTRPSGTA